MNLDFLKSRQSPDDAAPRRGVETGAPRLRALGGVPREGGRGGGNMKSADRRGLCPACQKAGDYFAQPRLRSTARCQSPSSASRRGASILGS